MFLISAKLYVIEHGAYAPAAMPCQHISCFSFHTNWFLMELDWEISCLKENTAEVTYFNWVIRQKSAKIFKMVAITHISNGGLKSFTLLRTILCRALVDPNTVALEPKKTYVSPWSSVQLTLMRISQLTWASCPISGKVSYVLYVLGLSYFRKLLRHMEPSRK